LLAALASVAQRQPSLIREMIRKNDNGTYDVRFFERTPNGSKASWVRVDSDLLRVKVVDKLIFGTARTEDTVYAEAPDQDGDLRRELWVAIIEKAYAKFEGGRLGFIAIEGGYSDEALFLITGGEKQRRSPADFSDHALARLLGAQAGYTFVCASSLEHPANSKIESSHAYTVLGVRHVDGEMKVALRNPWGSGEPSGNGKNDGEFLLSLAEFRANFSTIELGNPR
jgi:hypothetical protein